MIDKLFKQMMEEKHAFYHYMGLYESCTDPAIKSKLHTIATQEVQHYKDLYDIIFKDEPGKVWTDMEKWFKAQAKEWYEDMIEDSKNLK